MSGVTFEDKSTGIVFSNKTKVTFIAALLLLLIITAAIAITPCRQDRLGFFQHKQTAPISTSAPNID